MKKTLTDHKAEEDNFFLPLLEKLGVGHDAQRLFLSNIKSDEANRLVFQFNDNGNADVEYFGYNTHKLSTKNGIWLIGQQILVKDVFLFYSAMEAIVFSHLFNLKFKFENSLFVALGAKPNKEQIRKIKIKYKNARYHTVFGNDLLSHIYDCKISMWLTNKDCMFFLKGDKLKILSQPNVEPVKTIEIDFLNFNYTSFCRKYGKRSNLTPHKPYNPRFNSFLEYIKDKNGF
uniref:hypothetical protein n=1 Tax=Pedobacter sp. TaxID=1411316 RepID=UPI00159A5073|nr:hypothetical protein [Pedobacter sp.]QJS06256.1 hypothetical protein [Pedobacter sp.]